MIQDLQRMLAARIHTDATTAANIFVDDGNPLFASHHHDLSLGFVRQTENQAR
jgi:hypothetical protein